jgi:SAM-dependent methyltransferase
MTTLFACALFVSAVLLFWVQPLVGKMVLPLLGGTPAVWNTCMLFFQALLLAGYAYARALTRWLSPRGQALLHLALLAAAAASLPFAVEASTSAGPPADASPAWWLLKTLLWTTAPPFFVLSASAPLLQKWYTRTRARSAADPYFLYAASNAGSLAALLGFPTLLEPHLTLSQQSRAWAFAYFALAVLVAACAFAALRAVAVEGEGAAEGEAARAGESESLSAWRRVPWVLLAFVPSSLVLGVTTYITTDLVAVPLLWVIPLSLYLLSFVVVFAQRRAVGRGLAARVLPGAAVMLALVYLSGAAQPAWFLILFHLLFLFAAALVCHGQLADDRPGPAHLAEFYLWMAVGGVLGGLFNALLAPLLFNSVVEYPLVIVLAGYLRPAFRRERGSLLGLRLGARSDAGARQVEDERRDVEDEGRAIESVSRAVEGEDLNVHRVGASDLLLPVSLGVLAAALLLASRQFEMETVARVALTLGLPLFLLNYFYAPRPLAFAVGLGAVMLASALFSERPGRTLHASRNFYGTHRVESDEADTIHWLHHGSTLHGKQYTDLARRCEPLSYYHREGPLGSLFNALHARTTNAADSKTGILARPVRSVAVVGLGAGTTAAYARAGEAWTFYEIDPAVAEVARSPELFTYLSECSAAPLEVVVGDARLRLREAPAGAYDLIALDAFSSDAVPAHLLTREALALYLSKLAPGGVVAFHVSNRTLELERVVGGLAADAHLPARVFADKVYEPKTGHDPSTWVVVAREARDLAALDSDARWLPLDSDARHLVLWRDDFSDILGVFKWL